MQRLEYVKGEDVSEVLALEHGSNRSINFSNMKLILSLGRSGLHGMTGHEWLKMKNK